MAQSSSCGLNHPPVSDFIFHSPPAHRRCAAHVPIRATLLKTPPPTNNSSTVKPTESRITTPTPASRASSSSNSNSNSKFPAFPQSFLEQAFSTGRAAATAFCDTIEGFISEYIDPRQYPPSQDPKIQLAGNFAPVDECPPQECPQVIGNIPECLRGGAYIRNGANPLHPPAGGYHYFDGLGMLHSVKFSDEEDGAPIYCARFTKTSRFMQESAAGKPLFPNALGSMSSYPGLARIGLFAIRMVLGVIDVFNGVGTSNAGMAYFDRRILAMSEEDVPHAVRVTPEGDIVTMGRYTFNKRLNLPMCAHPKIDPVTGELFAFSFNPVINPYLRYFWSDPEGNRSPNFDVWLPEPCLFHDFAITENYAIFPENKVVMNLANLILKNESPIKGQPSKRPRFGILPRKPTPGARLRWIEVPTWTSFHTWNAWEEGDKIVFLGSSIISQVECIFDEPEALVIRLHEIHLDLGSGRSYAQHVCSAGLDFGQINQKYLGRKNRFVYLCRYGPWPKFSGLAKVDLEAPRLPRMVSEPHDPDLDEPCIVSSRKFEPGTYCNEPFFVPRCAESGEEDDGYVLCHVHNENTNVSELLIMDAKSPTLETVAAIRMPARVPYGFHGVFVTAEELENQSHVSL